MVVESDFREGGTITFNRQDLLDDPLEGMDEGEVALVRFFRRLSEDPNIAGVAVSRMKFGGIYTHFFVKDMWRSEAMSRTLETTGDSFRLLESASQHKAGYSSYICLGKKSFDEAETSFRKGWNRR